MCVVEVILGLHAENAVKILVRMDEWIDIRKCVKNDETNLSCDSTVVFKIVINAELAFG